MKTKNNLPKILFSIGFIIFWSIVLGFQNVMFPYYIPAPAMFIAVGFYINFLQNMSNQWMILIVSSIGIGGLSFVFSTLLCNKGGNVSLVNTEIMAKTFYCEAITNFDYLLVFLGYSFTLLFLFLSLSGGSKHKKEKIGTPNQERFYNILLFFLFILPIIWTLFSI